MLVIKCATLEWISLKLILLLSVASAPCLANFQEGDFIPTARKAQFHGVRSIVQGLQGDVLDNDRLHRLEALLPPVCRTIEQTGMMS